MVLNFKGITYVLEKKFTEIVVLYIVFSSSILKEKKMDHQIPI